MIKEAITNILNFTEANNTSDVILRQIGMGSIPLTPKMISRIFPKKKMYYFHALPPAYLAKLPMLIKSKKQISAFTKWDSNMIFSAGPTDMEYNNVIVAVLEGYYNLEFPADVWTTKDKQGKRWIDVQITTDLYHDDLGYILSKISKEIINKTENILKINGTNLGEYADNSDRTSKEKYEIIKTYNDTTEKTLLKYAKDLKNAIFEGDIGDYNEIIGYNFDIVNFLVTKESEDRFYINLPKKLENIPITIVDDLNKLEHELNTWKRMNK